jgi:hypothetical protein
MFISQDPLDKGHSNKHILPICTMPEGIETYQTEWFICCKKLSRFSCEDELTFLPWGFLFPVALQIYEEMLN